MNLFKLEGPDIIPDKELNLRLQCGGPPCVSPGEPCPAPASPPIGRRQQLPFFLSAEGGGWSGHPSLPPRVLPQGLFSPSPPPDFIFQAPPLSHSAPCRAQL